MLEAGMLKSGFDIWDLTFIIDLVQDGELSPFELRVA